MIKKSLLKEKTFIIVVVVSAAILSFATIVLIIASLTGPFHIRKILLEKETNNMANIESQSIMFTFNNPVLFESINLSIDIFPKISFAITLTDSGFIIKFTEVLKYNTNYTIFINKNLTDIYSKQLNQEIKYSFVTMPAQFAYLERNYPTNLDKIVIYNVKENLINETFSAPIILLYDISNEWLIVYSIDSEGKYVLTIKSLNGKKEITLDLPDYQIAKVSISPLQDQFLFVARKTIKQEINGKEMLVADQRDPYNKIYLYSLDNNSYSPIYPTSQLADVIDATYTIDGSGIIFKSNDVLNPGHYLIYPLNSNLDSISLGFFTSIGNFNLSGNKLVFVSFDRLNPYAVNNYIGIFDSNRKETKLTNGENSVGEPEFGNLTNRVYFSSFYNDVEGTRGLFEIKYIIDNRETPLIKINDKSLENPKLSADENYLLAEMFTKDLIKNIFTSNENFILRDFINHKKPGRGELILWDINLNSSILTIENGIDPKWLK